MQIIVKEAAYSYVYDSSVYGKKETLQQIMYVVDENGFLKIDNIKVEKHPYLIMVDGKLLFDYSKPASFYNVFGE